MSAVLAPSPPAGAQCVAIAPGRGRARGAWRLGVLVRDLRPVPAALLVAAKCRGTAALARSVAGSQAVAISTSASR